MGLLMILSPTKTLNLEPCTAPLACTSPDCDTIKTLAVIEAMKAQSEASLQKKMGISANLAKTAYKYWSKMEEDASNRDPSDTKPCVYAFSGVAYQGLDATSLSKAGMQYLQENLRIVDPLYGVLRPLDMIQPYRLEMKTPNVIEKTKLAKWWQPSVTGRLAQDLEDRKEKILINLASDEYSAAVDASALPEGTRYVKIYFYDEGRAVGVYAKRARGLMVRYLAENNVDSIEEIQAFDCEGYKFVPTKSNETTLVFDRKKQDAKRPAKKEKATAKRQRVTK